MNRALPSLLGTLALLSGCTLFGLDDVALTECATHADCAGANTRYADHVDRCTRFQCIDRVCQLGPRDEDGDGFSPAECALEDVPADCDDRDVARTPDTAETCDGLDNDCDGVIDEATRDGDPIIAETHDVSVSLGSRALIAARGEGANVEYWTDELMSLGEMAPVLDGMACPVMKVEAHELFPTINDYCQPAADCNGPESDPCSPSSFCRLGETMDGGTAVLMCDAPDPVLSWRPCFNETDECLPDGCRSLGGPTSDETCAGDATVSATGGEYVAAYLVTRGGDDDPRGCGGSGIPFFALGTPTLGDFEILDGQSDQGAAYMDGLGCTPRRDLVSAALPQSATAHAMVGYVADTSEGPRVVLRAVRRGGPRVVSDPVIIDNASAVAIHGVRDLGFLVAIGTASGLEVAFFPAADDSREPTPAHRFMFGSGNVEGVAVSAGPTRDGSFPVGVAFELDANVRVKSLAYDMGGFTDLGGATAGVGGAPAIAYRDSVITMDVPRGDTQIADVSGYDVAYVRGDVILARRFARHENGFVNVEDELGTELSGVSALPDGWLLSDARRAERVRTVCDAPE